jgi:hypothetical protein
MEAMNAWTGSNVAIAEPLGSKQTFLASALEGKLIELLEAWTKAQKNTLSTLTGDLSKVEESRRTAMLEMAEAVGAHNQLNPSSQISSDLLYRECQQAESECPMRGIDNTNVPSLPSTNPRVTSLQAEYRDLLEINAALLKSQYKAQAVASACMNKTCDLKDKTSHSSLRSHGIPGHSQTPPFDGVV